ncbi:hypothetical protein BSKO_07459 [Bryopsis sp. KO-2023]|nr:hypothetical protein BSKO_07459 [Bryopsis sp. KO-2023]
MERSAYEPLRQSEDLMPGDSQPFSSAARSKDVLGMKVEKWGPDIVTVTFPKPPMCSCWKVVVIALYIVFGIAFICFGTLTGVDKSFSDVPLYMFIPAYVVVGGLLLSCLLASSFTSHQLKLTPIDLSYHVQGLCNRQNVSLPRSDIQEVRYVDRMARLSATGKSSVRKVAVMAVVMDDGAVHELLSDIREEETKWVTNMILQEMPEMVL